MKKLSVKKICALLLALAMLAASSACTGGNTAPDTSSTGTQQVTSSAEAAGEPVTLEVWHSQQNEELQKMLQDYEQKNTNVKINQTVMFDEDYKTQSRVALAGGVTPDVWWTNSGSALAQFANSNGLMDLSAYQDKYGWKDRYYESALKSGVVNEKLYALPWGGTGFWATCYVNKTFFEANGLQYPKTVDDLYALAPKIREKGMEPMTFYEKEGWFGAITFGDLVLQQAGAEWVDGIKSGKIEWAGNEIARNSLEILKKMSDAGCFLSGYETTGKDAALQMFKNGKCAIMYNGTWFPVMIGKDFDFEIETISFPQITPDASYKAYQCTVNWVLGVCPATKHPEEAVAFVDYACSPEYLKRAIEIGGEFSPVVGQNDEIDFPYYMKAEPLQKQFDAQWVGYFHTVFDVEVCSALIDQIKMVLAGQISPDEALKAVDAVQKQALASAGK
jgi:raffinose/stachyose/melibiose transport system substrate-binding protein